MQWLAIWTKEVLTCMPVVGCFQGRTQEYKLQEPTIGLNCWLEYPGWYLMITNTHPKGSLIIIHVNSMHAGSMIQHRHTKFELSVSCNCWLDRSIKHVYSLMQASKETYTEDSIATYLCQTQRRREKRAVGRNVPNLPFVDGARISLRTAVVLGARHCSCSSTVCVLISSPQ